MLEVDKGAFRAMDFGAGLYDYFKLQDHYRHLFDDYRKRGVDQRINPDDTEFAAGTPLDAYMGVGVDAMRVIVGALTMARRQPPTTILDYPSGSGRVTRHLQAFFPEAQVYASDLYERHLDFCRDKLGAKAVISNTNPADLNFGVKFDLIYCGSLLTHFPEPIFAGALSLLGRSLSPSGIAIITLHGRHAEHIQRDKPFGWQYMPDADFGDAGLDAANKGFGYADYDENVRRGLFGKQEEYGISLSRPRYTMALLERNYEIRVLNYIERGWHNHQDVLVIGKPGVNQASE